MGGRHPEERSTNEESLKHLSAHLEALQNQRISSSSPRILSFYLRDSNRKDKFKLIKIHIEQTSDVKIFIKKILESCSLSTDYVNKIKSAPIKKTTNVFTGGGDTFHGASPFSDEYEYYQRIKKTRQEKTLKVWLQANLSLAHERSDSLADLREDVEKLEKSLSSRLNLKSIQYDCGWNIEHYRGCLKSLERLANMHEKELKQLEDRNLVFALISGVSLEGDVMLFTGDVQRNWLDFIKNISKQDDYLKLIPSYESALSQVLREIRIARRKFMPKAQVVHYASQLTKVTTSMLDYLTFHKYPKSWPDTLKDFEIVIESEAGPLMVSPTGQFIAPSTCPGSILVDFLTTHMDEATQKMEEYKTNKYIERELHQQCVSELHLKTLTKDDSIDPNKMIECLKNLIKSQVECRNVILHITHYYSVLADGTVCIPWDWTLE
ncbi:hypothetical protein HA402_004318 [Bradysia odoriphaga]|nr:hypothetical protein HA402_004318 [Bradysia odoriphaga]